MPISEEVPRTRRKMLIEQERNKQWNVRRGSGFCRISSRFRQRVQERILPKELLERLGIPARKTSTGKYYILCQSDHPERTPSLILYPDKHFKCLGCGISGDMIDLAALTLKIRTARDVKAFFSQENFPSLYDR